MANTRNSDSAKVDFSLSSLDVPEAGKPVRVALRNNKVVEFPNFADMPYTKVMSLLEKFETSPLEAIEEWLSEEDLQTWRDQDLTMGEVTAIITKLGEYVNDQVGDLPKEDA